MVWVLILFKASKNLNNLLWRAVNGGGQLKRDGVAVPRLTQQLVRVGGSCSARCLVFRRPSTVDQRAGSCVLGVVTAWLVGERLLCCSVLADTNCC